MIIDTHNHICPDKVAPFVLEKLTEDGFKAYGKFTAQDLLSIMDRCNIAAAVVFNVAEKPSLVQAANDFLVDVCDGQKLIGLATIHPDYENFHNELDRCKAMGLTGVKFSSLFQDFFADEERMLGIYQKLSDNDMIAYFHVGKDPVSPAAEAKTSPQRLARVLEMFPRLKVVAAHFGGLEMLDEAEKYLWGKELYLDTTWYPSLEVLDTDIITRLIKKHGAEKIFFGTDYPFSDTQKQVDCILKLPIGDEERERILWKNANEFFGIHLPY